MKVAVSELGVVAASVEQRVRAMGLVPLGLGDRFSEPPIVLLATQLQDPFPRALRSQAGSAPSVSATAMPSVASCVTSGKSLFPGRFA